MNLKDLKAKEPLTAWFDFDQKLRIQLKYIDPAEVRALVAKSTKLVNGRDVYDEEKAIEGLAERILDWNLTVGKAAELMALVDIEENIADDPVPCVLENKVQLIKHGWTFKPFVEGMTVKLDEFMARRLESERKNLKTTSAGSPKADSTAPSAGN